MNTQNTTTEKEDSEQGTKKEPTYSTANVKPPSERYQKNEEEAKTQHPNNKPSQIQCPECSNKIVSDEKRGEKTCSNCGLVIDEDAVDRGPEWRSFTTQEKQEKSRVGSPVTNLKHDKGLSTNIGSRDKDANGNQLSAQQRRKMKRLRTWNERFRTRDSSERNLKQALGEIERMASALGLVQSVRETASMIYRQALNNDMLPGRSIEGVTTAALYAAARIEETPRTLDEMRVVSRVDKREIARDYRYINRELQLDVGLLDPLDYIPRFASEVDVTRHTENKAVNLVNRIKENNLHTGKSPPGIAAAALYTAAMFSVEDITQGEVADASGITEVTIRKQKKLIVEEGEMDWVLSDYREDDTM